MNRSGREGLPRKEDYFAVCYTYSGQLIGFPGLELPAEGTCYKIKVLKKEGQGLAVKTLEPRAFDICFVQF